MCETIGSKNGVDVDKLVATIQAIREDPDIAKFQFRSQTKWVNGGHCQTEFKDFFGAKAEDDSRPQSIIVEGDEPPILLGENHGANAVEAVLHALASCLCVGLVYNAAARGISIESLEFRIKGDIDLHAFLGLSETMRAGYSNIAVTCNVKSDATQKQMDELFEYVQKTSPVLDIVRNPVQVVLELNCH